LKILPKDCTFGPRYRFTKSRKS